MSEQAKISPVTLDELLGDVDEEVLTYDVMLHQHELEVERAFTDETLDADILEYLEG